MTIPKRVEVLAVVLHLVFFAWCYQKFDEAREAKARYMAMVDVESEMLETIKERDECHRKFTLLTVETFEMREEV